MLRATSLPSCTSTYTGVTTARLWLLAWLVSVGAASGTPRYLDAQRLDGAAVTRIPSRPLPTPADTAVGPPITARRAFIYSFLLPGYGQAILDRPTAGAIFVLVEGISIAMARKSARDLAYAKRTADSIVVGIEFENDPVTGLPVAVDTLRAPGPFPAAQVSARRTHLEDWIALLIFNHLFAGADAFVAAHLWDLPARVTIRGRPEGAVVAASLAW